MKSLSVDIVVGALWGDEGKGKYVANVCQEYDAVLRVNASTNAGHCVDDGKNQYVTRQLPSYFHPKNTDLIVSPGALLNLPRLKEEIEERPDIKELRGRLKVASSISLVLDSYVMKTHGKQSQMIGSTHQGTGPSAVARCARHSLHLYDIEAALNGDSSILDKIAHTTRETLPGQFDEDNEENREFFQKILDDNIQAFQRIQDLIGPFCVDYTYYIGEDLRKKKKRVLIEGCNGLLLDNLHGAQPHTTSAPTNLGAMITGANFAPQEVENTVVVMAAYSTCLGKRPFPSEMSEEESSHFYKNCNETDVAEAIRRRLGWLDIPALRKALVGSANASLHLNKLDVFSGVSTIKVCARYEIDGSMYDYMPDDPRLIERAIPHYESLPGWTDSISGCQEFSELPQNAQSYVRRIEEWLGLKICSIGTGPKNADFIKVLDSQLVAAS